ncbi:VirB3 family type IV secretion system protein [Fusobacterium necrophorum]|nr:VirB3 family type IV secretion system protein [Fusobacterium necrophorum]
METKHEEYFNIPVYQAFTKPLMFGGLPLSIFMVLIASMIMALFVFHSIFFTILFFIFYIALYVIVKLNPRFDPLLLEIVARINLKKFIHY